MTDPTSTGLPRDVTMAFAPLHKRHFGTAIGLAFALVVALVTFADLIATGGNSSVSLLDQFFYGYTVTPQGALIGALWGFFVGWVAGWFVAFCRNFFLAAVVFWVRARTNLQASRDFLDHI